MKNFGKRLMAMAMAVAMTGAALILPPAEETFGAVEGIRVSNGDLTESEPNNTRKTANSLVANQAMTGSTDGSDADYFEYTVTENGPLRFLFEVSDPFWSLNFQIYDSSNANLYRLSVSNGGRYTGYLDYKKGTKLCVMVSNAWGRAITYSITPEQASEDPNWAVEPNNSKKKATTLKRNLTKNSVIHSNGDVDYFKYKATKSGKVKFTLSIEDQSSDYPRDWSVQIYNKSGKLLKKAGFISDDTEITFKVKKKQTYYVKITGGYDKYGLMYGATIS